MTRLPSLGPRGEGWVVLQFVLLPLVLLAGIADGGAWEGPVATLARIAGLVLMAIGAYLVVGGLAGLGRDLTPFPHPRAESELVESGVYAQVRHPIYGGLIAGAFGWGLFSASPLVLVLALVTAGFFRLKAAREEAWLAERFPGYRAYMGRTKRFFPHLV